MSPQFSIVTPVYNTPHDALRAMIASVLRQTEPSWELILIDDCSPDGGVRTILREAAASDARIRVLERGVNGHIVRATNDGLAIATGEFIALVDHDDLLTPNALAANKAAIAANPAADVLYSDEDRLLPNGHHKHRFAKPDWSPWRLRSQNYFGHLTVIRSSLMREIGGFREGFDGSQDHDLVLRATEHARQIVHIPEVLYHWRVIPGSVADRLDAKPYATEAAIRAIEAHLRRTGIAANVRAVRPGLYKVSARLQTPRVSIIISAPDGAPETARQARRLLERCMVHGRRWITDVQVVRPAEATFPLKQRTISVPAWRVRTVEYSDSLNSGLAEAVRKAGGDYVVVLAHEVLPDRPRWLRALLTPLVDGSTGLVGGYLHTPGRGVVGAGLVGDGGVWHRPLVGLPDTWEGPFGALQMIREVDAVTGGGLAFRSAQADLVRQALESGDSTHDLGITLSAAVRAAAMNVVWTGHCQFNVPHPGIAPVPAGDSAPTGNFRIVDHTEAGVFHGVDRFVSRSAPWAIGMWTKLVREPRHRHRQRLRRAERLRAKRLLAEAGRNPESLPAGDPLSSEADERAGSEAAS
jgi:hypothetical protein